MNQRNDLDEDEDTTDTKLLLQKAWCHGQSVAPPLIGGMAVFSSSSPGKNQSWFQSALILAIVTSWPIVSWRSMQRLKKSDSPVVSA